MKGPLVVVGDALLDRDVEGTVERICPDGPVPVLDESGRVTRPGGAALAAVLAKRATGGDVVLVSAIHSDPAGEELAALLRAEDIEVVNVARHHGGTTEEKIRLRSGGQTLLRLDRGDGRGVYDLDAARSAGAVLRSAAGVLVADYGRGITGSDPLREALKSLRRPVVWDPHPRGSRPVPGCHLVTPNAGELAAMFPAPDGKGTGLAALTESGRTAIAGWECSGVAVTRGALGALLVTGEGTPLAVPTPARHTGDTCGAGDAFAATATISLATGALLSEAVTEAVAAAARFVRAGAAGGLLSGRVDLPTDEDASDQRREAVTIAEETRAAGGVVVAAGGCFDILHAGHVALLESARALGDCLIVCINSDASVRRLKGPGRPVNDQWDRAATLAALGCVDAVEVFEEDDPVAVIESLRPDLWVKGGDYDAARLPESDVLRRWGGQAVIVPYLQGRSTTGLLQRVAAGPS